MIELPEQITIFPEEIILLGDIVSQDFSKHQRKTIVCDRDRQRSFCVIEKSRRQFTLHLDVNLNHLPPRCADYARQKLERFTLVGCLHDQPEVKVKMMGASVCLAFRGTRNLITRSMQMPAFKALNCQGSYAYRLKCWSDTEPVLQVNDYYHRAQISFNNTGNTGFYYAENSLAIGYSAVAVNGHATAIGNNAVAGGPTYFPGNQVATPRVDQGDDELNLV